MCDHAEPPGALWNQSVRPRATSGAVGLLAGLLGDDAYLYARAGCARMVVKTGLRAEIAALYRF